MYILNTDIALEAKYVSSPNPDFQTYSNNGGKSGIIAYAIGTGSITVQFSTGWYYEYTYNSAGESAIETMKSLAESGSGLNSFIMRNVKNNYAWRWL